MVTHSCVLSEFPAVRASAIVNMNNAIINMSNEVQMPAKSEGIEWPTFALLIATYLVWGFGVWIWGHNGIISLIVTGIAVAQFSSLQHEALHGHPTRNALLNEALVFPALCVFIPFRRFRDTHLLHHHDPALTDPYDDPESNYADPHIWPQLSPWLQRVLKFNNTLLGRMVLGPLISLHAVLKGDLVSIGRGDRAVQVAWLLHLVGLVPVLVGLHWLGMPVLAYLGAVYLGLGLVKIRTFLEHRAHETARARTVVVEDRGPLALLFLNNNFHAVHHMHPGVAWYRLPGLYASRREHYLRCNQGYVYQSYAEVFRLYLTRAKDPVPHPVWPVEKTGSIRPDQTSLRKAGTAPELSKNGTPGWS